MNFVKSTFQPRFSKLSSGFRFDIVGDTQILHVYRMRKSMRRNKQRTI